MIDQADLRIIEARLKLLESLVTGKHAEMHGFNRGDPVKPGIWSNGTLQDRYGSLNFSSEFTIAGNSQYDRHNISLRAMSFGTRASAMDTAYQPSTTRDSLVQVSVSISFTSAGDGKVEFLSDAANPPTTVRATVRNGSDITPLSADTKVFQFAVVVQAAHYYKLLHTDVGGACTYAVVGNAQETLL